MRKIILFIIVIFSFGTSLNGQDFYDIGTVNSIHLYFSQANWDQVLDQLYAAGEERLVGNAVINGVSYDSVGVRFKGNSSYSETRSKNPFNIKLDYIIDDQKIGPYGTIKLANGFSDPSFIRETMGYEIARKYMPSSKANYTDLYVNDVLIGVYTSVQDLDDYFGEQNFNTGDLARIKGINDSMNLWSIWGYINATPSSYTNYYELDSGENLTSFINFLNIFNNNNSEIESVFNVDRHLWMTAFDNLFVNLDAPINFGHNYYLYEDSDQRFNTVLWDLNMCFGGFTHLITGANLNLSTMQNLNPLLNTTHASYPILNKVFNNEMYKRMYIAHMRTMIEENVTNGWIATRGAELQTVVASHVQSDPNFFYTYSNFNSNLNNTVTGGGQGGPGQGNTVGITQLMNTRATYLLSSTPFQGTIPSINSFTYSPEQVQANSSVTFIMNTANASNVYLGYRQGQVGKFTRVQMFDDGNHNDGISGDGIFGIDIQVGQSSIQYYGYAENSSQGKFIPARAEFEFLEMPVGILVDNVCINEVMAKNTLITDPNGEFDDWVELYNPSDASIDIGGMYMVDSHYNEGLASWTQIPTTSPETTTMPAHGYLVVWFDEQVSQGPLHINEKLGGSADAVYLISSNGTTVIDSLVWTAETGLNTDDVSIGRLPDGGDNWMLFGANQPYPTTLGATNQSMENSAPVVTNIQYSPHVSTSETPITISANVIDAEDNLVSVQLLWGIGDWTLNTQTMNVADSLYTGLIGPFPVDTSIQYRVKATDLVQESTLSPIYTVIIGYTVPTLYINEFMPANTSTITDENGEYEDWVEIYNPNDYSVDLGGLYLTDNHYPETATMTQIPITDAITTIPAHGYKMFWFDEDMDQGIFHVNTKLGTSGDAIYLVGPDMQTIIDSVSWNASTGFGSDLSMGRITDGGDSWTLFGAGFEHNPTPGISNNPVGNSGENGSPAIMELSVYPNPVKSKLHINLKGTKSSYKVQIYNIKGQLVKTYNSLGEKSTDWDLRDRSSKSVGSGLYFLRVITGSKTFTRKIIILH